MTHLLFAALLAADPGSYRGDHPVRPQADGLIVAEAEEFRPASPGWQAKEWGSNYYAATFANCFLSRKAYLGAPEQTERSEASITVTIPEAGRYLALARYEAAYRFETQFRLRVEQDGKPLLDRLYGARANPKIWAFREKIKPEVAWPWGAVENVVWEGHDAFVDLKPGKATLTLVADRQPEPAARRNVDLVLLTRNVEDVQTRIDKENYLPLDGLLTQSGDVFLKVHNRGALPVTVATAKGTEHSPYWVHLRTWKPVSVTAPAGQATDWVEVGSVLDSLNDGQWPISATAAKGAGAAAFDLEFGVADAAGQVQSVRKIPGTLGTMNLAFHADTRYSRLIRTADEVLDDLLTHLKKTTPPGQPPKRTLIYGTTFDAGSDPARQAKVAELKRMFALANADIESVDDSPRGYVDVRSIATPKLAEYGQKLAAEGKAAKIAVVSLGDEIGLGRPGANDHAGFRAWAQAAGLKPSEIDPAAGSDWAKVQYNPDRKLAAENPSRFYHSMRYAHAAGIAQVKQRTDILRQYLPNAGIGANFSPHHGHAYLGEVHQWVHLFRQDGMTMPWGEDYIWQLPVGSPQMNQICLDLFRAGVRHKPNAKIHYYVMPHWPGNTTAMWRRQFFSDLGHGMKVVNLFEFRPVQAAYTENHVSLPAMFQEVRKSFHELAAFEDVIQDGQVRPADTALWFSETGDIWDDYAGPFAADKRALYVALRQQELPLDLLIEADALDGTLKQYKLLVLTDRHVSRAVAAKITEWVNAGGQLLATAGAGLKDEYDRPNEIMEALYGIKPGALETPDDQNVRFIKQDLPFIKPLDTATFTDQRTVPVVGARHRFTADAATVLAKLSDGSPAAVSRNVGQGRVTYCGFLPGLSYFQPAIPKRPADRGSTDDAFTHFLPTDYDPATTDLIRRVAEPVARPVTCSQPFIETSVVESKSGVAIPIVNWSGQPVKGLTVTVRTQLPGGTVTLASGQPVKTERKDGVLTATLDLDIADALVIR